MTATITFDSIADRLEGALEADCWAWNNFYGLLAHKLTVQTRIVADNQTVVDAVKVARLAGLNEILHGILGAMNGVTADNCGGESERLMDRLSNVAEADRDNLGAFVGAIQLAFAEMNSRATAIKQDPELAATDLRSIVARMKAEVAEEVSEDQVAGRKAGRSWASDDASPKQLRRLEKAFESETPEDFVEVATNNSAEGAPRLLAGIIDGERQFSWDQTRTFWEAALGADGIDLMGRNPFAVGFIEGALEVWDEVKDQV